jgi:hypothetical protein
LADLTINGLHGGYGGRIQDGAAHERWPNAHPPGEAQAPMEFAKVEAQVKVSTAE